MKKTKIFMILLVALSLVIGGGAVLASNMTAERLEEKQARLDELVQEGVITPEQQTEIVEAFENCDGSGLKLGQTYGISFGEQQRKGNGENQGQGRGQGSGQQLRQQLANCQ